MFGRRNRLTTSLSGADGIADELKPYINHYLEAVKLGHTLRAKTVNVGNDRFDLTISIPFVMVDSNNIWALTSLAHYFGGLQCSIGIGQKKNRFRPRPPRLFIGPPGS